MSETAMGAVPRSARARAKGRSRFLTPQILWGAGIVLFFVLLALFAGPLSAITGNDPYTEHRDLLGARSVPRGFGGGISPSHWFGVTPLRGIDLFSVVAYGTRVSLGIGLASTLISVVIGVLLGLIAGYFPGMTDALISRTMDVFFGFPFLIFAIALSAIVPDSFPRPLLLILVLGLFGWPSIARLMRGQTLTLTNRNYTTAAQVMGASSWHILLHEILPGLLPLLIVRLTLSIPGRIAAEASLSFLGVGINPPTPSWGRTISDAVSWALVDPMYLIFPGFALFLVTFGFNLLGDGLSEALDPRSAHPATVTDTADGSSSTGPRAQHGAKGDEANAAAAQDRKEA